MFNGVKQSTFRYL